MNWTDQISTWLKSAITHSPRDEEDLSSITSCFVKLQRNVDYINAYSTWLSTMDHHLGFQSPSRGLSKVPWEDLVHRFNRKNAFYVRLFEILIQQVHDDEKNAFGEIRQELSLTLDLIVSDDEIASDLSERAAILRNALRASMEVNPDFPEFEPRSVTFPMTGSPVAGSGEPAISWATASAEQRGPRSIDPEFAPVLLPADAGHPPSMQPSRSSADIDTGIDADMPLVGFESGDLSARKFAESSGQSSSTESSAGFSEVSGDRPLRQALLDSLLETNPEDLVDRVREYVAQPDPGESLQDRLDLLHRLRRAALRGPAASATGASNPIVLEACLDALVSQSGPLLALPGGMPILVRQLVDDLCDVLASLRNHRGELFRPLLRGIANRLCLLREEIAARPLFELMHKLPDLTPLAQPRTWRVLAEVARRLLEDEPEGRVLTAREMMALVIRDALKDGHVSAQENEIVRSVARALSFDGANLQEMVEFEIGVLKERGTQEGELDATALFRSAVRVAAADGVFEDHEKKLLHFLSKILHLDKNVAQKIVDEGRRMARRAQQSSSDVPFYPQLERAIQETTRIVEQRKRLQIAIAPMSSQEICASIGEGGNDGFNDWEGQVTMVSRFEGMIVGHERPVVSLQYIGASDVLRELLKGGTFEILVRSPNAEGIATLQVRNRCLDKILARTSLKDLGAIEAFSKSLVESAGRFDIVSLSVENRAVERIMHEHGSLELTGALFNAIDSLEAGRVSEAVDRLESLSQRRKDLKGVRWRLGDAFASLGEEREARTWYESELEIDRGSPEARLRLARIEETSGGAESALEILETGLELYPNHPGLLAESLKLHLAARNSKDRREVILDRLARLHGLYPLFGQNPDLVSKARGTFGATVLSEMVLRVPDIHVH